MIYSIRRYLSGVILAAVFPSIGHAQTVRPFDELEQRLKVDESVVATISTLAPASKFAAKTWVGPAPGFLHKAIEREAAQAAKQATVGQQGPEVPHVSWRVRHPVAFGALLGSPLPLVGTGIGACVGHLATAKQKKYSADAGSTKPDVPAIKRMVALLGPGERINVTKMNGEQSAGDIGGIAGDVFSIVPDGQTAPVPIAYADVRNISGKPMSGPAKAGIAACIIGPLVGFGLFAWAMSAES
jgi:hypothetical protein